jgi:isoaspartyl peptidase/L-asparaginase-like protein (Ntn-hydrolase superfamily)
MPNRREFLYQSLTLATSTFLSSLDAIAMSTDHRPLIISTWPFGRAANEKALAVMQAGGSALDGVEQGIRLTEGSGNLSVGLSGKPNAAGFAQLDACIMNGPGHQAGSVAALEGIPHPISVARRVMEKTPHVMLVGHSARSFAISEGFTSVDIAQNAVRNAQWWEQRAPSTVSPRDVNAENHDTITLLVLAADGTIAGGCSTSGLADKLPGRVGDSPIIGGGLYVDNAVGAAGATGIGENVMRYCATFLIVEYMRNGMAPAEACQAVIDRIAAVDPKGYELGINFIALDKQGRFGAAGTADFPHAVTYPDFSEVLTAPAHRGAR